MSDEPSPKSNIGHYVGCVFLGLVFLTTSGMLFLMSIFGECGAWADADCVQPGKLETYALFPGGPIILAIAGYFIFRASKRGGK